MGEYKNNQRHLFRPPVELVRPVARSICKAILMMQVPSWYQNETAWARSRWWSRVYCQWLSASCWVSVCLLAGSVSMTAGQSRAGHGEQRTGPGTWSCGRGGAGSHQTSTELEWLAALYHSHHSRLHQLHCSLPSSCNNKHSARCRPRSSVLGCLKLLHTQTVKLKPYCNNSKQYCNNSKPYCNNYNSNNGHPGMLW